MPFGILSIKTRSGKVLYTRKGSGLGRVVSDDNVQKLTQLMIATVTSGTGKAARLDERPSAGKTGTSQDFHDAWFVGFTADLVCGVWIGNDDNTAMVHAVGGGLPAHIFKSFMEAAEKNLPVKPLAGAPPEVAPTSGEPDDANADAVPSPTDTKKPDALDRVLDSLFNAT